MGKECSMHASEGSVEQIFDWKMGRKGSIQKVCVCEYGRIILKWNLKNCIRMDFGLLCFGRVLNDILMNSVMYRKFHKIVGNILII
jgi:hypothetical protein